MPRKKTEPLVEPKTFRVRVEPYFAVRVVDDPAHRYDTYLGRTAREALTRAKSKLAPHGTPHQLLVVNGKLIHAVSWSDPTYPDDDAILDEVLRITGGTLLE